MNHKFFTWVSEYKVDSISRMVLASLICKYEQGNKEALFGKFKQLIEGEHYKLAVIFRDCLTAIGLNQEFINWLSDAEPAQTAQTI